MMATALARWAGPAGIVGGLLWVPYGVFEMLEPWGTDTVYRDDVGYSVITDTPFSSRTASRAALPCCSPR